MIWSMAETVVARRARVRSVASTHARGENEEVSDTIVGSEIEVPECAIRAETKEITSS